MRPLALGLRAPYRLKRTIALLAQATLNLDFTRGGPIDSRVTFTRASGGTSFRPVSYGPELIASQDLSTWTSGGAFGNWNGATATATTITTSGANGARYKRIACTPNTVYRMSAVVTGGSSAGSVAIAFGTSAGVYITHKDEAFVASGVASSVLLAPPNAAFVEFAVRGGSTGQTTSFASIAASAVLLDLPGDPIQLFTAPANVPRFDYDPVSRLCKGLLVEEQRTNLVTHSHEFDNAAWSKNAATVVPNAAVAPDGTLTADKIIATSANTQHYVFGGGASIAANSTGTLSIYAKAAEQSSIAFSASGSGAFTAIFDLAAGSVSYQAGGTAGMSPVVNGWYRCWFTCTTTAFAFVPYLFPNTSNSYAGDGVSGVFVWGGQHESGAFHTSHIPTSGAAATRAAEAATLNTLAPWYVAGGTLFAEFTHTDTSLADRVVLSLHSTSWVNNAMHVRTFGSSAVVAGYNGATNDVSMILGVARVSNKVAVASANNDFASCLNGGAVAVDSSGTVPPVNMLAIGCSSSGGGNSRNGHIRRVAYWPRRMSNLDLQGLTR